MSRAKSIMVRRLRTTDLRLREWQQWNTAWAMKVISQSTRMVFIHVSGSRMPTG
jgi:hypothetical protein